MEKLRIEYDGLKEKYEGEKGERERERERALKLKEKERKGKTQSHSSPRGHDKLVVNLRYQISEAVKALEEERVNGRNLSTIIDHLTAVRRRA